MTALRSRGFSLVESLVVLGLVGLLLCCITPVFKTFMASYNLNLGAKKLASDLRQLQSQAFLAHQTLTYSSASFTPPPQVKIIKNDTLAFSASGYPPPGGSGTIILQNSLGKSKSIILSSVGRVRIE